MGSQGTTAAGLRFFPLRQPRTVLLSLCACVRVRGILGPRTQHKISRKKKRCNLFRFEYTVDAAQDDVNPHPFSDLQQQQRGHITQYNSITTAAIQQHKPLFKLLPL